MVSLLFISSYRELSPVFSLTNKSENVHTDNRYDYPKHSSACIYKNIRKHTRPAWNKVLVKLVTAGIQKTENQCSKTPLSE